MFRKDLEPQVVRKGEGIQGLLIGRKQNLNMKKARKNQKFNTRYVKLIPEIAVKSKATQLLRDQICDSEDERNGGPHSRFSICFDILITKCPR